MENIKQYRIARGDIASGESLEGAFETRAEAEVALAESRVAAVARQREAEFRRSVGQPWHTDDFNLEAIKRFDECKFFVKEEPAVEEVYRLNSLPSESGATLREVLFKLRVFGKARLCWTCHGRTRSEWQGAASASFLESMGFKCEVGYSGDVEVTK